MNEATKQTSNLICENSRHLEIHGSEYIIECYESQKSRSFLFQRHPTHDGTWVCLKQCRESEKGMAFNQCHIIIKTIH